MTNCKNNISPAYSISFPNSGLLPIGAVIPQTLFSEIAGKNKFLAMHIEIFPGQDPLAGFIHQNLVTIRYMLMCKG